MYGGWINLTMGSRSPSICFYTLWPCDLNLWPSDLKTTTYRISEDHSLYQVLRLWDHHFSNYAADRQKHRHTDRPDERFTPATVVGLSKVTTTAVYRNYRSLRYRKESSDSGRYSDCYTWQNSWFLIRQVRGADVCKNQLKRDNGLDYVAPSWAELGMWLRKNQPILLRSWH